MDIRTALRDTYRRKGPKHTLALAREYLSKGSTRLQLLESHFSNDDVCYHRKKLCKDSDKRIDAEIYFSVLFELIILCRETMSTKQMILSTNDTYLKDYLLQIIEDI